MANPRSCLQLVFLELQLSTACVGSEDSQQEQQQNFLLGPGARWCLGFGSDTHRRSVFLRALGQAIIDANWIQPPQVSPSTSSSEPRSVAPFPTGPFSTGTANRLVAPEYCGYARCKAWLSVRSRAAMGKISVDLAREVAHFQAEVTTSAPITSKMEAERLLRHGRSLARQVRTAVFTQEREVMKRGLLSCPAWQEGGSRAIPGSNPQRTIRCDAFVRLLSVGGGLLPAEPARGRRYLLLRADTPTLEIYKEKHPEAALSALSSLPLALFQEDDVVSHRSGLDNGASDFRSRSSSDSKAASSSSRPGSGRSSDVGRASSTSTASSASDIDVVRAPRGAIEAGSTAAAGLQQNDCWSGSWRLEKVEEVSLAALSVWGQVTHGRGGAPDTLAVVNGAGHAFEMQLPSVAAATRWKEELLAASRRQADTNSSGSGEVGLQSYLARGRRGGISGLSKSGWFWCERGKAGGGKWSKRWLELDPDGQLRIFTKKQAKALAGSPADSGQIIVGTSANQVDRENVIKVNCESATIRRPKNSRKDRPHAFRLEVTSGAKDESGDNQTLKFILQPVDLKAVVSSQAQHLENSSKSGDRALCGDETASFAYNAAFGSQAEKLVEEETIEWIEAIRAAGAAAAARIDQYQMALDDDVDSVLVQTIGRLSEEAVLLPVLGPLLEAAATSAAPKFDHAQQSSAVALKQTVVHSQQLSEERKLEAAAVRWLRSTSMVAHCVTEQRPGPVASLEGVQKEDQGSEWIIFDEETARVLENAYQQPEDDTNVMAPHIGQNLSAGSSSNDGRDMVAYHVDFASMTLGLATVVSDGDDRADSGEVSTVSSHLCCCRRRRRY